MGGEGGIDLDAPLRRVRACSIVVARGRHHTHFAWTFGVDSWPTLALAVLGDGALVYGEVPNLAPLFPVDGACGKQGNVVTQRFRHRLRISEHYWHHIDVQAPRGRKGDCAQQGRVHAADVDLVVPPSAEHFVNLAHDFVRKSRQAARRISAPDKKHAGDRIDAAAIAFNTGRRFGSQAGLLDLLEGRHHQVCGHPAALVGAARHIPVVSAKLLCGAYNPQSLR